jgi:hypothetical protein
MALALALALAASTWLLWPAGSEFWRKAITVILSVSLGFQIATAIGMARQGRVAAVKAWLECGAFPVVMAAFLYLPSVQGWLLLISGWFWRFLVRNVWK